MKESDAIALMEAQMSKTGSLDQQHRDGDEIVSDALRSLGWGQLADKFDEARALWWYS